MQSHTCVREADGIKVSLIQTDYGDDEPVLDHFNGKLSIHLMRPGGNKGALFDVGNAEELLQLVQLLTVLGREDVAAAVTELAVTGGVEAGPADEPPGPGVRCRGCGALPDEPHREECLDDPAYDGPEPEEYDPGPEVDDEGGMSEYRSYAAIQDTWGER